ncbi:MAG: hypothetical protein NTX36_12475 [Proteobacteria bacterium]|nr:hypothetical protein [Pseudomonadota bacterium]
MSVNLFPMPESYRKISKKFRPGRPPLHLKCGEDGKPLPEEIEEARELFKILDEESKDWWGRGGIFKGL